MCGTPAAPSCCASPCLLPQLRPHSTGLPLGDPAWGFLLLLHSRALPACKLRVQLGCLRGLTVPWGREWQRKPPAEAVLPNPGPRKLHCQGAEATARASQRVPALTTVHVARVESQLPETKCPRSAALLLQMQLLACVERTAFISASSTGTANRKKLPMCRCSDKWKFFCHLIL